MAGRGTLNDPSLRMKGLGLKLQDIQHNRQLKLSDYFDIELPRIIAEELTEFHCERCHSTQSLCRNRLQCRCGRCGKFLGARSV